MNAKNMPGFTAEASLYGTRDHYRSATRPSSATVKSVLPQMIAARSAGDVFSGSSFCGPGYCCVILCYLDNCYYYCWSPSRLPIGF